MQPAYVGGDAVTTLTMQFPLLQNLSFNQVKVRADAQIRHLALPDAAFGLDLGEGAVSLGVDAKGLDVAGTAQLGGVPVDLKWRENFTKAAPFRRRYQVAGSLDDAGRRKIGLDTEPFQPPFLTGPVPVEAVATMKDGGQGEVEVTANLTPATMGLPGLNWDKPAGVVGQANATLRLKDGRLDEVPRFFVSSVNGLGIDGRVGFEAGRARDVVFDTAKWGRTDVKGRLTIKPEGNGLAVDLTGPSFDARELVSGRASDHSTDKAVPRVGLARPEKRKEPPRREDKVPLEVKARLAQVWISDQGAAQDLTATLTRDRHEWQQVQIDAQMGRGKPFRLAIHPAAGNRRSIKIEAEDAGAVFRAFDVFENVVGGRLLVDGWYDDGDPWQPLSGVATVADYSVVKAPALARLLTVAALTGIVELLTGQGIHFSTLEAPFTLTDGVLQLKDARASGPALGLTAKGQVDLDYDVLALEGTVVPIYVLNSVLGQIPVLGPVFSGEKGGGIVAMNYSMKGPAGDPRVTINPFSALTPGFLRKLFNIFDQPGDTEVRPTGPGG
jgi:uncharacterized protein YhdP